MTYTDLQKECHCSIQYKTNNDKTRDYSLKKKDRERKTAKSARHVRVILYAMKTRKTCSVKCL